MARTLSLFALLLVGCSGAGNSDLFTGAPGEPGSSEPEVTASEPTTSTKKQQPTAPGEPAAAPAPAAPAPAAPTPPATTPDPAPPPAPTCTHEDEPNDEIHKATSFTTSICGKINTASDIDYVSFVVPPGKTEIAIKHDETGGKVAYRYYIQGIYLPFAGDGMTVIPGVTYSIQMKLAPTSATADRPNYQVDISFK